MPEFLHTLSDVKMLFELIAAEKGLRPAVVEKYYWIMHCLWGLQQVGLQFEMKGGTSLSKGWRVVNRFSEGIDIRFDAPVLEKDGYRLLELRKNRYLELLKETRLDLGLCCQS